MNFLVASGEPWFGPLLSKQHVAMELCRQGHKVLFVDPWFRPGHLLQGRRPHAVPFPQPYHRCTLPNLRRLRPFWLPKTLGKGRRAHAFVALQVRLARFRPDCLIVFDPRYAFLAEFWTAPTLYYAVDTQRNEDQALSRADWVVAATPHLYERYRAKHSRVVYLPHGVAPQLFTCAEPPTDLPPRPRAGFLGAVNDHLDLPLLTAVARQRPDVSFVLIGPHRAGDFGRGLPDRARADLSAFANVHLLGPRPAELLGSYLGALDVGLIPYDLSHADVHFSLHKVLQYLAADLPVVSTVSPPPDLEVPSLSVGTDPVSFEAALGRAFGSGCTEERSRFVDSHTWARRVQELLTVLYAGGALTDPSG